MDLIYLGIAVLFFLATWGLMKLCEILDDHKEGEQS
jgi:hypothetical protein